jgi:hypothetical protein
MHEAISHPGLRFTIFQLHGSLRYTLTRPGKAPKVYDICDSDLDDGSSSESSNSEETDKLKPGLDASAVGVQLRLIKNDGVLKMEFEGRDGATADWTFEGLALVDGGRMVAAAVTQTEVDGKKCVVCGEEKREIVEVKHEETQTDVVATLSIGAQTATLTTSSTGVQTATKPKLKSNAQTPVQKLPVHRRFPQVVELLGPFVDSPAPKTLIEDDLRAIAIRLSRARKILDKNPLARSNLSVLTHALTKQATHAITQNNRDLKERSKAVSIKSTSTATQTEPSGDREVVADQKGSLQDLTTTTNPDLKRKASSTQLMKELLHKRPKSKHDSEPWP